MHKVLSKVPITSSIISLIVHCLMLLVFCFHLCMVFFTALFVSLFLALKNSCFIGISRKICLCLYTNKNTYATYACTHSEKCIQIFISENRALLVGSLGQIEWKKINLNWVKNCNRFGISLEKNSINLKKVWASIILL